MLAPVQTCNTIDTASGSPLTSSLTFPGNITAGNLLVVFILQFAAGTRTYTVSDSVMGATGWVQAVVLNPAGGRGVAIWYNANHTGGSVTVSVVANTTGVSFGAGCQEWSGFGGAASLDATSSLAEGGTSNNHTCSAAGVSSAKDCIAFCGGVTAGSFTEGNPGSGYTEITTTSGFILAQQQHFTSGCTNEVGAWSNTGSARAGVSCIALLSAAAAGPSIPVLEHHYRQLRS